MQLIKLTKNQLTAQMLSLLKLYAPKKLLSQQGLFFDVSESSVWSTIRLSLHRNYFFISPLPLVICLVDLPLTFF